MNKKRASMFIVTLLLLSFVLTGCGADTIGYLSYVDEMQKKATTNATETVSTLSLSDVNFPAELIPADQRIHVQKLKNVIGGYYIATTQKVNPTKDIISISIDAVKKGSNEKENLLTLNYKDQAFAMSTSSRLKELLKLASPKTQATIAAFDNKLIPISALDEALGLQKVLTNSLTNQKELLKVNHKSMAYLKDIISIYMSPDMPLIIKENNSYVFEMDTPAFVKTINTIVSLTMENPTAIFDATLKFYESLTDEEFNMLYGELLGSKGEVIALFKESMNEMEEVPENAVEEWNTLYTEEIAPMILKTMDGSSLRMRTWKENDNYYTNTYGILKVAVPDQANMSFHGTFLSQDEMKIISDDFDVTMPTEVIADSVLKSILPPPIVIEESNENYELTEEDLKAIQAMENLDIEDNK